MVKGQLARTGAYCGGLPHSLLVLVLLLLGFLCLCVWLYTSSYVCACVQFENAMILMLDELVAAGHGDEQYQELFADMCA